MENVKHIKTGLGSIGLIEAVPHLIPDTAQTASFAVQTLIQIIVGIAALIKLFKKKKTV